MKKVCVIIVAIIIVIIVACSNIGNVNKDSLTKHSQSYEIIEKYINAQNIKKICFISYKDNKFYYISNENQVVYAEIDNNVVTIKGSYKIEILPKNIYVDVKKNIIYGIKNNMDDTQTLLSIDMNTGNIEDVLADKDIFNDYIPDYYYNYHKGILLFKLKKKNTDEDTEFKYWGLIDLEKKKSKIFDAEKILSNFTSVEEKIYKQMIVLDKDKIMIVTHPQNKDDVELYSIDISGKLLNKSKVDKSKTHMAYGLSDCHISDDGKYLLYSMQQTPINLVLLDLETYKEYMIVDEFKNEIRMFSGWRNNNTFVYQVLYTNSDKKSICIVDIKEFIEANSISQ